MVDGRRCAAGACLDSHHTTMRQELRTDFTMLGGGVDDVAVSMA